MPNGLKSRFAGWAGRPTLVAVAAINAITGAFVAVALGPVSFGADAGLYRECALQLSSHGPGCGSLYPPLAAVIALPLTLVPAEVAAIVLTSIGLGIIAAGVLIETRGQQPIDRILVGVAALGFAPVVYELLLGQVTLISMAAVYLIVRSPDASRRGIPLGIVMAVAPKPLLLPILVWMLVWRRWALLTVMVTAVALTMIGVAMTGPDQYQAWLSVIDGAGTASTSGTFALAQSGNRSLWPLDPPRVIVAGLVGLAALWAIARDPDRGFVAALLAALILAPYTQLYAVTILLLAVRPALSFAPRATRVLAVTANLVLIFTAALVPWAAAGLIATVPNPWRHAASGTRPDDPPVPVTERTTGS